MIENFVMDIVKDIILLDKCLRQYGFHILFFFNAGDLAALLLVETCYLSYFTRCLKLWIV